MAPRRLAAVLVALCAHAASTGAQSPASNAPDLVLTGGRIFTADSARPWVQALAIRGERIVAVGTSAEIQALAAPSTRRIELAGRVVIPGINDAHDHLGWGPLGTPDAFSESPMPDPAFAQVADSVAAIARRTPAGTWIYASVGTTVLDDPAARRAALDRVAPAHPVWLQGWTGHGTVMNTAALRIAGVADTARDPVGGWYGRDQVGRIDGLLHGYAAWNARRTIQAAQQDSTLVRTLRGAGDEMVRFGITSVQDMSGTFDPARAMRVIRAAELPVRVRVIPMPATTSAGRLTGEWNDERQRQRSTNIPVSGVKWVLDGTPVERLAVQRAAYADRAGHVGQSYFPIDTIAAIVAEARASDEQLMVHVSGDSTAALVLSLMARADNDSAWRRRRVRLEHGDGLAADLQPLARRLGVVVVQNPSHLALPHIMGARLGARTTAYGPLRSLVERGIPVALGSDGPRNPYLNILLATVHPNNPAQALTREQAVRAYTWGSAYAEHAEREKGTLAPGMLADLAVLSQDIFTVAPDALPATVSVLTLVGGKVVHDSGALQAGARSRGAP